MGREDFAGLDYLIWKGSATNPTDDEFSKHNKETAHQMVMNNYPKVKLGSKIDDIRYLKILPKCLIIAVLSGFRYVITLLLKRFMTI